MYKKFFIGAVVSLAVCVALCGCDMFDYISLFEKKEEITELYPVKAGRYVAEELVTAEGVPMPAITSFEFTVEATDLTDDGFEEMYESKDELTKNSSFGYIRNQGSNVYYFVTPHIAYTASAETRSRVTSTGDSCISPLMLRKAAREGGMISHNYEHYLKHTCGFYGMILYVERVDAVQQSLVDVYSFTLTFDEGGTADDMPVRVAVEYHEAGNNASKDIPDAYTFRLKYKSA